jgi:hypothetical protein
MEHTSGEQAHAAVFAGGPARHRLVRAASAAGVALLAAWLIALALGVLGGFDPLPGLPSANPDNSASSSHSRPAGGTAAHKPHPWPRAVRTQTPVRSTGPAPTASRGSSVRTAKPKSAPSTSTVISPTTSGRRLGTTKPIGKPIDSPGNAAGGSGAPGQLR